MNPSQKSVLLFLLGCMPMRIALAYIAKQKVQWLPYLGTLALMPALGFWIIYLTNARQTGTETFGRPIWWNSLRPVHGFLYFCFAVAALQGNKDAWVWLGADVVLGTIAFASHHLLG